MDAIKVHKTLLGVFVGYRSFSGIFWVSYYHGLSPVGSYCL